MGQQKKRNKKGKNVTSARAAVHSGAGSEEPRLSYKVEHSDILGRYLTSSKNLAAGEIIMIDEAIVVGPCQESKPVCIGCYISLNLDDKNSYERCEKCSWPLCSKLCPGKERRLGHSVEECKAMAEAQIKDIKISDVKSCFYAVAPLRLLLLKSSDPKAWVIVKGMETHTEKRQKNLTLWKLNEELGVEKIQKVFGMSRFTAEEIHFACGVLEVNAFEIARSPNSQPLRAVYPNAFLFSHDCVPNTSHSNGDEFSLIVRTMKSIPKNFPLTVSYTYTLQSTLKRRSHLLETKFFACECKRCSDVTEFGTFCSAVKCPKCKGGLVLPEDPLNSSSDWKCTSSKCSGYKVDVSVIHQLCDGLSDELDAIDGNDVLGYENFLKKSSNFLHENHCLCLGALHCLFQLYGKVQGFLINYLSEEQLERKENICRHLLKVFEKLEPGLSKQRGILLYELQAPLMLQLRRRFEQRIIEKKEIKKKIREVCKYLEESWRILSTEWENSEEGQVAAAAKEALSSMSCWDTGTNLM